MELIIKADEVIVSCGEIQLTLTGKNDALKKADRLIIHLPSKTIDFINASKLFNFLKCPICGKKCEKINDNSFKLTCNCNSGVCQV